MSIEDKIDLILNHARAQADLLCEIALVLGVGRDVKALTVATEKLKEHTEALKAAIAAQS